MGSLLIIPKTLQCAALEELHNTHPCMRGGSCIGKNFLNYSVIQIVKRILLPYLVFNTMQRVSDRSI